MKWRGFFSLAVATVLSATTACEQRKTLDPNAEADRPIAQPASLDAGKLAGRWVRPDGGYVLQLTDIGPSGKVTAAYFNPNPIHVAHAEWRTSAQNLLIVAVELRDLNYPGATYTLRYDQSADRLAGAGRARPRCVAPAP